MNHVFLNQTAYLFTKFCRKNANAFTRNRTIYERVILELLSGTYEVSDISRVVRHVIIHENVKHYWEIFLLFYTFDDLRWFIHFCMTQLQLTINPIT